MKFYCLTVRENPWRNEEVTKRFAEHGLDVEMFYGVHGQVVGVMPLRTVWDNDPSGPQGSYRINPGKTSITISKLLLFQHILDRGDEECVIFENDVNPVRYFPQEFETSYKALPEDWQVCHLGFCCADGKPQTKINDRITAIFFPLCDHAVMWKRSAIQLAYDTLKQCDWGTPSDTILAKRVYPKLQCYSCIPQLAFPDGTDSEAAKMEIYTDAQGWCTPDIIAIYNEQLDRAEDHHAVFVEVGTWRGRSAIYMAEEIKRRLKHVEFFAVDTWLGSASDAEAMNPMIEDLNNRYGGDGLYKDFIRNINRCGVADWIKPLRMPSVEAATKFSDRSVDFVYIDAGHSYEDVLSDCQAWYPKMRPGSTLAGHDIARASVKQAVAEFSAKIGKPWRQFGESWLIDGCNV